MSIPARRVLFLACCCAWFGLVAACDDDHPHTHDGSLSGDSGAEDSDDEDEVPCTEDFPGARPGLSAAAGELTVKLVSADPPTARQYVNNDWVLEVLDGEQNPVDDFTVSDPVSFMRVHSHYGTPDPTVQSESEPGEFKLDNIRFRMRGPWEVNFQLEHGGKRSPVSIKVCVE